MPPNFGLRQLPGSLEIITLTHFCLRHSTPCPGCSSPRLPALPSPLGGQVQKYYNNAAVSLPLISHSQSLLQSIFLLNFFVQEGIFRENHEGLSGAVISLLGFRL